MQKQDKRAPEIVLRIWVEDKDKERELREALRRLMSMYRTIHRGIHYHLKKEERAER